MDPIEGSAKGSGEESIKFPHGRDLTSQGVGHDENLKGLPVGLHFVSEN